MYSNTPNHVVFYKDQKNTNTEKTTYGRVSRPVKTGRKGEDGKDIYEYETWAARFVGKAREAAALLEDKARITVTEWIAHYDYNKEKKQGFAYLSILGFEVRENTAPQEFEEVQEVEDEPF